MESTLTKTTDPATLPAGNGQAVAGSSDGAYFFVGHSTTPFLTVYERAGSAWSKLTDPSILPGTTVAAVALGLDDKLLAVGVQSSSQPHPVYSPWGYDSATEFAIPVVEVSKNALSERSGLELKTYIRAE